MRDGLFPLCLNVLGGFLTVLIIDCGRWVVRLLHKRSFRHIFGQDGTSDLHLVYAELALPAVFDADRKLIERPYTKPDVKGAHFSIDRPVSSSEFRATSYLAQSMGAHSGQPPRLASDHDLAGRLDLSFIAFGGPLSNLKTQDALSNAGNDLLDFDNDVFFAKASRRPVIVPRAGFDYGLILKLHPSQFTNRTWLVCAGRGEWGTSGAAWYLSQKWPDIHRRAGQGPFAVVVQVKPGQDESAEQVVAVMTQSDAERYGDAVGKESVSDATWPAHVGSAASGFFGLDDPDGLLKDRSPAGKPPAKRRE